MNIRRPFYAVLALVYAGIVSCHSDPSHDMSSSNFKTLQLQISSPFGCYDDIELESSGLGTSAYGLFDSEQRKVVKQQRRFEILSDSDKRDINLLIGRMQQRPLVSSGTGHDLYHFLLVADSVKLIDKYAQDSLLDKLLTKLTPYVVEENNECDFFYLFKKTMAK
jgi:hypothetical protein